MSVLALVTAAPLAMVQANASIPQVPVAHVPVAPAPVVQALAIQPQAKPDVVQLAPQAAYGLPAAAPAPEFRVQAEASALAQPVAPAVQPITVTYRLAANLDGLQGPPSPDPMANDIAWANAQTAQARARAGREGWKKIIPYEIAWQLLNALDAAQTIDCSRNPTCEEANPLFGNRPSTGAVLGVKGGMAIAHYLLMRHLAHRNWKAARVAEIGTILVQGVITGLNFRYAFK